ncbi:MAG: ATP-binding protein [Lentisphaeraceae bacterium]|nr:ATP-binding protein [Lentisphaeraceae bacterium]
MNRDIINNLIRWKDRAKRKPVILRGARQVGKTTIIRQVGELFENFVEINFEEFPDISALFQENLEPYEICRNLENYFSLKIIDGTTLLFLDEIQCCPRAILALRYFYEKRPKLHVIAAGSLLDFELEKISFPVGRIDFYYLYPLSFGEFLDALGKGSLRKDILKGKKLVLPIHKQLLKSLRDYTITGGMPEVVAEFIATGDLTECQNIQSSIIETFIADFAKYAKRHQIKYLTTIFNAIPSQLGRKLKYSNISTLYKSRDLGDALHLLELAGLLIKVHHSSANGIPLEHEKDHRKFKVIFFDVGLAMRILRIPFQELIINDDITLVNEGALAEQFVGQELLSYSSCRERTHLYYWHREAKSSNAEVDYVIEKGRNIIPIEVKSGLRGTIRSLNKFCEEKNPDLAICLSRGEKIQKATVLHTPLYSIEYCLHNENS